MNNQITILDNNNQSVSVDLICYFSTNNKKYIFYTKNENVQDGLIKMYVSEENIGVSSEISQDDWNNLKKIMQGIITGSVNDIQYLSYSNPVKFNEGKAIALNDANITSIKTAYKNAIGSTDTVLNKDILSQSFANPVIEPISAVSSPEVVSNSVSEPVNIPTVEPVVDTPVVNSVPEVPTSEPSNSVIDIPEPVQISSIPQTQNTFNMESTPVNLSVPDNSMPIESSSPNLFDSVPKIEPVSEVVPSSESNVLDNNSADNSVDETPLNINNIKPGGIDSGFKVSNEPNIFDQVPSTPFPISQEEINKPIDVENVQDVENTTEVVSPISSNSNTQIVDNNKMIELNERKIKLFEELANVYREENELLKSDNSSTSDNLEHTASNLFNNNGTLNVNEVLNS